MDLTVSISTEEIQRQALLILFQNLNSRISSLNSGWSAKDASFYSGLGRSNPGFTVEQIPNSNFIPGVITSVINQPISFFPNVCCIAYRADPKRSTDDTGENYTIRLAIEVLVKSDNFNNDNSHLGEEQVNSRIQKTLEAVHQVILDFPTLNNTVPNIGAPTKTIGNCDVRREKDGTGKRWFWQGGMLEYPVDKYVNFNF